jgi:peptide/nickel transport system permease protein
MGVYVIKRILAIVPVMAVVAAFVFLLLRIGPEDPAVIIAGDFASSAEIARLHTALGLDEPIGKQFVLWLWGILHGDLGVSIFSKLPVTRMISQRLEPTVALAISTMVFSVVCAVPIGALAAWNAGSWIDRAIMAVAVLAFSLPVFVVGYILVFGFALHWGIFPVQGFAPLSQGVGTFASHLVLPTLSLGLVFMALLARMTRATMLEALEEDYIRTARAKGLGVGRILFLHALKNAAAPIITTIGGGFALVIGGAVVTESVFAIPGIGLLTVEAILHRDYPVIQGIALIFSAVYVLINLVIDLAYPLFDPRIRY